MSAPTRAAPRHRGQPGHHRAQRLRHRHRPDRSRLRGQAQRRPPQPLPDPGAPPAARTRQPGTRHRRSPRPPRRRRRETAADRDRTSLRPPQLSLHACTPADGRLPVTSRLAAGGTATGAVGDGVADGDTATKTPGQDQYGRSSGRAASMSATTSPGRAGARSQQRGPDDDLARRPGACHVHHTHDLRGPRAGVEAESQLTAQSSATTPATTICMGPTSPASPASNDHPTRTAKPALRWTCRAATCNAEGTSSSRTRG